MLSYILRRLGLAIVTVLAISVISFAIIQLPPGDYVDAYVAQLQSSGTLVTQDVITNLRAEYGLGQPIYVQYGKWMGKLVHGDLGESLQYKRPVTDVIGSRLAGACAAAHLALAGRKVVALDRLTFPSDQLSTHLLFPAGVDELRRMGALEAILASNPTKSPWLELNTTLTSGRHTSVLERWRECEKVKTSTINMNQFELRQPPILTRQLYIHRNSGKNY